MKNTKLRISAIAVLSALLLASCSSATNGDVTTTKSDEHPTEQDPSQTTAEETTAEDLSDNLPEKDFDGSSFRIMVDDEYDHFIFSEEQTGQPVDDAVYTANTAVEERFNVNLELLREATWTDRSVISTPINAGEDAFDVSYGHDIATAALSLQGLFMNLYEIPHLDFDKPWWPKYTVESLTLNDRMYLISNYSSYYGFWSTRTMFFNTDLVKSYNMESPYELVRTNQWTLDKIISMTKDVYQDLNGNSQSDYADLFGFAMTVPYCLLENFDIEAYEKVDGGARLELGLKDEKIVNLMDKLVSWLVSGEVGTLYSSSHSGRYNEDSSNTMFANGNVVFTYGAIGHLLTGLVESDTNYGILPMPKYDETVEDYVSGCTELPGAIPVTVSDTEFVGIVAEAMAAEGYKTVMPAYYEVALKNRYSYDTDSAEMLEIIFSNRKLSFSYMYGGSGNGFQHIINNVLAKGGDFASYYAANEATQLKVINDVNEFYSK